MFDRTAAQGRPTVRRALRHCRNVAIRHVDRVRATVVAVVAIMVALGVVLAARRWVGALDRSLAPWQLSSVALGGLGLAEGSRRAWERINQRLDRRTSSPPLGRDEVAIVLEPGQVAPVDGASPWSDRPDDDDPRARRRHEVASPVPLGETLAGQFVAWGGSAGLALLAFGCCYPGDRTIEWLVWLPLLVCDQFWRQSYFDGGKRYDGGKRAEGGDETAKGDSTDGLARSVHCAKPDDCHQEGEEGEEIVQQLFRVREADGREAIYGILKADFQQGQRVATLHVGFCPPIGPTPDVEAEPWDFPGAQVKVAQSLAHGVRIDVRLNEAAEEACLVQVDFAARPSEGSLDRQAS